MPRRQQFSSNEEYNKWYRDYRAQNRSKMRRYSRKYNSKWRKKHGYHNEKKWKLNNKYKVMAENMLQYAVKTGRILKNVCEICGNKKSIAHHDNYEKPLEVRWLCKAHHYEIHRQTKSG